MAWVTRAALGATLPASPTLPCFGCILDFVTCLLLTAGASRVLPVEVAGEIINPCETTTFKSPTLPKEDCPFGSSRLWEDPGVPVSLH